MGQYMYLVKIFSLVSNRFEIYTTMTTIEEVKRFKRIAYMEKIEVIRYKRDKKIKIK